MSAAQSRLDTNEAANASSSEPPRPPSPRETIARNRIAAITIVTASTIRKPRYPSATGGLYRARIGKSVAATPMTAAAQRSSSSIPVIASPWFAWTVDTTSGASRSDASSSLPMP